MEQVVGPADEEQMTESKWPLPFNISLEKLELILKGYFQAGGDTHEVAPGELTKTTGLSATTVRANSKFLTVLTFLRETDNHAYILDQIGADYVRALSSENHTQISALIRKGISNSSLQELVGFIELRAPAQITYEQLFNHVKTMARLPDNPKHPRGISGPYVTGINTLIDLLSKGTLLPSDFRETKIEPRAGTVGQNRTAVPQNPRREVRLDSRLSTQLPSQVSQIPISINITIEAKDNGSIRELVTLIRELRKQSEQEAEESNLPIQ